MIDLSVWQNCQVAFYFHSSLLIIVGYTNNSALTTKSPSFYQVSHMVLNLMTWPAYHLELNQGNDNHIYMVQCPFQFPAHKIQDGYGMITIM